MILNNNNLYAASKESSVYLPLSWLIASINPFSTSTGEGKTHFVNSDASTTDALLLALHKSYKSSSQSKINISSAKL